MDLVELDQLLLGEFFITLILVQSLQQSREYGTNFTLFVGGGENPETFDQVIVVNNTNMLWVCRVLRSINNLLLHGKKPVEVALAV